MVVPDFCCTFNLTQLVKEPTRVTDESQTLFNVVLTTNENIVNACEVKPSTIGHHSLVCVTLKLKAPKLSCSYITKNYTHAKFIEVLAHDTKAPGTVKFLQRWHLLQEVLKP